MFCLPTVPLIGHLEECLLLQSAAVEAHFIGESWLSFSEFTEFLSKPWQSSENVTPDHYTVVVLPVPPVHVSEESYWLDWGCVIE